MKKVIISLVLLVCFVGVCGADIYTSAGSLDEVGFSRVEILTLDLGQVTVGEYIDLDIECYGVKEQSGNFSYQIFKDSGSATVLTPLNYGTIYNKTYVDASITKSFSFQNSGLLKVTQSGDLVLKAFVMSSVSYAEEVRMSLTANIIQ